MSWTLCTSGSAVFKAGANVNAAIIVSGSAMTDWSDEKEGMVCALTRRDWVTNYSSLSTPMKNALKDVVSSMIAKELISYNMDGYTSRNEAVTMLNVQDDVIKEGIRVLSDFKSNTLKTP